MTDYYRLSLQKYNIKLHLAPCVTDIRQPTRAVASSGSTWVRKHKQSSIRIRTVEKPQGRKIPVFCFGERQTRTWHACKFIWQTVPRRKIPQKRLTYTVCEKLECDDNFPLINQTAVMILLGFSLSLVTEQLNRSIFSCNCGESRSVAKNAVRCCVLCILQPFPRICVL